MRPGSAIEKARFMRRAEENPDDPAVDPDAPTDRYREGGIHDPADMAGRRGTVPMPGAGKQRPRR